MKQFVMLMLFGFGLLSGQSPNADEILKKVDANMVSKTRVMETTMIVHGKRKSRSIRSKSYGEGNDKAFTEYLSPAREKGTKMLKLKDQLWIYSPSTDRTIQLSGHMLKQSVMGSDLSYEDFMDERKLTDVYTAKVLGTDSISNRKAYRIELKAKVADVTYHRRMVWVDVERYVPLQEELYAKSGQLLKKTSMSQVTKVGSRWFPKKMNYRDMLKDGKGTDFVINSIEFDVEIPAHIFNKASLKK